MANKNVVTLYDIPQDIRDLIDCGVFTEEEVLERVSNSANKSTYIEQTSYYKEPMKDIYYIVGLKDDCRYNLRLTTINEKFCGRLIHQSYGNLYFELNGSKALVIVPEEWIAYCAPSSVLWNK